MAQDYLVFAHKDIQTDERTDKRTYTCTDMDPSTGLLRTFHVFYCESIPIFLQVEWQIQKNIYTSSSVSRLLTETIALQFLSRGLSYFTKPQFLYTVI